MKLQKNNESLGIRNLLKGLKEADTGNKGVFDYEEFEIALNKCR